MCENKSLGRPGRCWPALFLGLFLWAGSVLVRAEDTIPLLTVGSHTFSNVTVTTKTPRYIVIMHAQGMASIRLKELSPDVLKDLGYKLDAPAPSSQKTLWPKNVEVNARFKELGDKTVEQIKDQVQQFQQRDSKVFIGCVAGLGFIYLFWCYCVMLICKKAGYEPGALAWIPILQFISLYKAAGMSGWCLLLWFVPFVNLGVMILWCVKISQARGKSGWLALPLLLPGLSFFTFLYLAFADAVEEKAAAPPEKITFNKQPAH